MKKIFFLLSLVLCLTIINSCYVDLTNSGGQGALTNNSSHLESSESDNLDVSSAVSAAETKMFKDLPNDVYDGREVMFLVVGEQNGSRYLSREIFSDELSQDIINTAVIERNKIIEEKFDLKIKGHATTGGENLLEMARTLFKAQDNTYDIIAPTMNEAAMLATEGYLSDLLKIPNMRLNGEWWDQRAIEDLEIMGKLFFTTGDISILDKDCTSVIAFNKDVAKNYLGDVNLYEIVKTGNWTFEKMIELAKTATKDNDGEAGLTYKDNWGMLINVNAPISLFLGTGERFIQTDATGKPFISIGFDHVINLTEIVDLVYDKNACLIIENQFEAHKEGFSDVYDMASSMISHGKALFMTMHLVDLYDFPNHNIDFDYGILPLPKRNTEQDMYYSKVATFPVPGYAIPFNAKDKDLSALVLSALCEASTDTLKEDYYEKLLNRKRFSDKESSEMLDIIFENRVYDLEMVYDWGIKNTIRSSLEKGLVNLASAWEANKDAINSEIEKTIAAFELLNNTVNKN